MKAKEQLLENHPSTTLATELPYGIDEYNITEFPISVMGRKSNAAIVTNKRDEFVMHAETYDPITRRTLQQTVTLVLEAPPYLISIQISTVVHGPGHPRLHLYPAHGTPIPSQSRTLSAASAFKFLKAHTARLLVLRAAIWRLCHRVCAGPGSSPVRRLSRCPRCRD